MTEQSTTHMHNASSASRFTAPIGALLLAVGVAAATASSGRPIAAAAQQSGSTMDDVARAYVGLVLSVGRHDSNYVDAYYGPPEWKAEAERAALDLPAIDRGAVAALARLGAPPKPSGDAFILLRHQFLKRQLEALRTRVAQLQGSKLTFDAESQALYDATAPVNSEATFRQVLTQLDAKLPGTGPLITRYEAFRKDFRIPPDKLSSVFTAAINGCRMRTLQHIDLPTEERFTVEYVTGKTWGGYNWYQGGFRSLIQVNTDLPIYIDRAVDLACHEGYPGHHVYNMLLEQKLTRERGWVEFSVYPLFSPQSLIAEGTANFGIDVTFPGAERETFERDVLYPLAGLDPKNATRYREIQDLADRLSYAVNEAARRYLNGQIDKAAAAAWLVEFGLMDQARAEQRVRFIDQYRSYVINYNLGKDLVRAYVESLGGTADRPDQRWRAFIDLLASPRLASALRH